MVSSLGKECRCHAGQFEEIMTLDSSIGDAKLMFFIHPCVKHINYSYLN